MKNIMIGLFLTALLVLVVSGMGLFMRLIWNTFGPVVTSQIFIFTILWVTITLGVRAYAKEKNQKTEI